jgi:hypothetical protein
LYTPSRSVPDDIEGTIVRILAYMGGLTVLSIAVASFFRPSDLVASTPQLPPRPQWVEVERPHPAFDLTLPETGGSLSHYAILRREADDGRKDVLTFGEPKGAGIYASVEIYRPGGPEPFIDAPSEIAARIVDLQVTDDVKPAGTLGGKFGSVGLVDFAIAGEIRPRRCLGFARAFDDPAMQIAGWYCNASDEPVSRPMLACALDRLSMISAGGDAKVAELFAHAEVKRTFCGQRNPILAATPERHDHVPGLRLNTPHVHRRAVAAVRSAARDVR